MTETVRHLIAAAGDNREDDTPLHALADALDEVHPRGSDPRATIIRHSLNPQIGLWAYTHSRTPLQHHETHTEINPDATRDHRPTDYYLDTTLQTHGNAAEAGPLFTIMLGRTGWPYQSRSVVSGHLSHTEAREIADQFDSPFREQLHAHLTGAYGDDPRPKPPSYPEAYSRALS